VSRITRRSYLNTAAAAALAGGTPVNALAGRARSSSGKGFQLAEIFSPGETQRLRLARQAGVTHAIAGVAGALSKVRREEYVDVLTKIKSEFEAAGVKIAGVESHPVPAEKIKLGVDGRDEEIENYKAAIDALARIGVRMICYNFMAGLGWYRTSTKVQERGGALSSEFDNREAIKQGLTQWGEVSEEKMWSNIEYFQRAVIPVAEKAGVQMALHPDDPPLEKLRGIARIITSGRNYRRIMDIVPSPINGITFCQANFVAMGENIESLAKEWLRKNRIFFVHYRDIEGTKEHFRETFHDNGPTDMVSILKIYSEYGFNGPIRPDHAPTMEFESNERPGYAMTGKVFAFGYMKGIMDALKLPYA
jgi:mannonate dehydratase